MNMPISVSVRTNEVEYSFELNRKVTIITGYSGTGKTTLSMAVLNKNNSDFYEERISNPTYSLSCIYGADWKETLEGIIKGAKNGKRRIIIFDDSDIIFSREFAMVFKEDNWNLYIFINRFQNTSERSLSSIPFSIDSVYNLVSSGAKHWLEPKYNLESDCNNDYDCIITEDSGVGYKFLLLFNENISTARGKDKIIKLLLDNVEKLRNKRILLFVDLASYGSCLSSLLSIASSFNLDISLVENYECFEYLLLNSFFLKRSKEVQSWLAYSKSIDAVATYQSSEKMYEDLLYKSTEGTRYELRHGSKNLRSCYVVNCCPSNPCSFYIKGNKQISMFYKTQWQDLFKSIRAAKLLKI